MSPTPLLVSLAVVLGAALYHYRSQTSRLESVPGPKAPSIIAGNVIDLQTARVGTRYNVWAKQYGHTYKLQGPLLERWLIMGDPKGITHVLSSKASNYVRPEMDRVALALFFGKGLFTAEGEEHRKMRKTLNPAFTNQSVQEVSHVFFQLAHRLKSRWEEKLDGEEGAVFDIASALHMLSLDAISMTMFMHDLSATEGTIPDLLHKITNSPRGDMVSLLIETFVSMFPSLMNLPSPMKTWTTLLRTELGKIAEEVWTGSKTDETMDAKILKLLNEHGNAEGESMSKAESIANIIGILFAGSETSANVLSELLYELSRQPCIQQKLRDELVSFEERNGREPTYEDLMSATALPYLDAVIRETTRCKAVLMEIARVAANDDIIPLHFATPNTGAKHVEVKAGQIVLIPVRDGVNVDEEIWGPDAEEFRPERWMEKDGTPGCSTLGRAFIVT